MWVTQTLLVLTAAVVHREMTMVGGCKGPGAKQEPAGGGAHGNVDGHAPFESVYKDGFWHVKCLADYMNRNGDKFGGGAQRYEGANGAASNSSVVRYDVVVEPDAREPMTPGVCFNFCRTLPEMDFFGLVYGRECYCTHFYKKTTGDGVCDLPCEGDSAQTCGGQTNSDVYQMHQCVGGLAEDMDAIVGEVEAMDGALAENAMAAQSAGSAMQASGDYLEGLAEGAASPLAQAAKEAAGPVGHSGEDLLALSSEFAKLKEEASGLDPEDAKQRTQLEDAMAQGKDLLDASDQALAAADEWVTSTAPEVEVPEGVGATFVPVLRQLDPTKAGLMSVCNGALTGTPKVGLSLDECIASCDAHSAPKSSEDYCWAVQHFNLQGADSLCYHFSSLSELTSYDCEYNSGDDTGPKGPKSFLQKSEKKHKKHHRKHKHVRKHGAKKHQKRAPLLSAHPSSRFMLKLHLAYKASVRTNAGEEATCMVRFADVVGVTPEFKEGISHLNRCFAAK